MDPGELNLSHVTRNVAQNTTPSFRFSGGSGDETTDFDRLQQNWTVGRPGNEASSHLLHYLSTGLLTAQHQQTCTVIASFPAPVLIACSIKTEGKAWEKESRA